MTRPDPVAPEPVAPDVPTGRPDWIGVRPADMTLDQLQQARLRLGQRHADLSSKTDGIARAIVALDAHIATMFGQSLPADVVVPTFPVEELENDPEI